MRTITEKARKYNYSDGSNKLDSSDEVRSNVMRIKVMEPCNDTKTSETIATTLAMKNKKRKNKRIGTDGTIICN